MEEFQKTFAIVRRESNKRGTFASVADMNIDKANEIAKKFSISSYQDMDEMMQRETIDVVVVLTESGNHAKHVFKLANMENILLLKNQWR